MADSFDSSEDTTDGLIFVAAYESINSRLKFAEMKRYLLPRGKYRKSDETVFVKDLVTRVNAHGRQMENSSKNTV